MFKKCEEFICRIIYKFIYLYYTIQTKIYKNSHINKDNIRKIFIVKLYGIGNMILFTSTLLGLKRQMPDSKITIMIDDPSAYEVIRGSELYDDVILYSDKIKTDLKFLFKLFRQHSDINLYSYPMGNADIPLVTCLTRAKYRVGHLFGDIDGGLYTTVLDCTNEVHEGKKNLDLLRCLGLKVGSATPFIAFGKDEDRFVHEFLKRNDIRTEDKIVVIHPGASIPQKRWEAKNFALLADRLIKELTTKVIFVGSRDEEPLISEISNIMEGRIINAAGKTTLKQVAALISKARLFTGNDSGITHVASAVSTPLIALFGPTDIKKNRPWGNEKKVFIIRKEMECGPCYSNGTIQCDHLGCLKNITVEEVFLKAALILKGMKIT